MVDLPEIPRRLVTTDQLSSRVSPGDMAASNRAIADALAQGGEALVNYEQAAAARAYTGLAEEIRNKGQQLALDANGNADAFDKAWTAYSTSILKKAAPGTRRLVEGDLATVGGSYHRDAVATAYKRHIGDAQTALETEIKRTQEQLLTMASQGQMSGPEYDAAHEKYGALNDQLVANPAFGVSVEAARFNADRFQADLLTESVRHDVEVKFRESPAAAVEYAQKAFADPSLPLTAEERRKAVADATDWLTKLTAEQRLDRSDYRADARDVISTLTATDAYVSPTDIATLIARGQALHDPATVRRLQDAARLRDMKTTFRALPAGQQKLDVYAAATGAPAQAALAAVPDAYRGMVTDAAGKTGVPAGLLAAQISQESGFNPDAVGISQFMPRTAAGLGVNPRDLGQSIDGQARMMKGLLEHYGGDVRLALAGYNWGQGNVDTWLAAGGNPADMPQETRAYIAAITGGDGGFSGSYDPAVIQSYRKELGNDLTGLIGDAEDVHKQGWGLDADTAGLLVEYARAVDDPAQTRKVQAILEKDSGAAVSDLPPEQRQQYLNLLLSPDGPVGDQAVRARLVDAEQANAAHRQQLLGDAPLRYGIERGWFKADEPLDLANTDALGQNLATRTAKVAIVDQHEGPAPRSVLYPEEKQGLTNWWKNPATTPDVKVGVLATMAATLPPDTLMATLADFAGSKDTEMLAMAGALSQTNPDIGAAVIRGQAALATDQKWIFSNDNTDYRDARDGIFPSTALAPGMTGAHDSLTAAARAVYADTASREGDSSGQFKEDRWQSAIDQVTGGILEFNDQKIVAPAPGMSQHQFDAIMAALPTWALGGAVTPDGTPITPADLRRIGRLKSFGDGRYQIEIGDTDTYALHAFGMSDPYAAGAFTLDLRPFQNGVRQFPTSDAQAAPAGELQRAQAAYQAAAGMPGTAPPPLLPRR